MKYLNKPVSIFSWKFLFLITLVQLTSFGDIKVNCGRHTIAGTTGVVPFILLTCVTECKFALCAHLTGCIGGNFHASLHMVVDHSVIVIPEYVLGRCRGRVQDTSQRNWWPFIYMIFLTTLDICLWIYHVEMNTSGDSSCRCWHLTFIDATISVLYKLYLSIIWINFILHHIASIISNYLQNPVEWSFFVENIESVICSEPDQPIC